MTAARRKPLTSKQKDRIVADWKTGNYSVNQLRVKWGRSFYTVQGLVESTPSGNDNARKITLANKALVKAQKPDAVTSMLRRFHDELKVAAPNARMAIMDMSRGEVVLEVIQQIVVKVSGT